MAGEDPMQAIASLFAQYWARTDHGILISCLKGMFAAPSMLPNLLAIHVESDAAKTAANCLNGSTFVDACVKLGDRSDQLTAVAMHSATEAALRKATASGPPQLRPCSGLASSAQTPTSAKPPGAQAGQPPTSPATPSPKR